MNTTKHSDAEIESMVELMQNNSRHCAAVKPEVSKGAASMLRQLLAERNERQTVQAKAEPVGWLRVNPETGRHGALNNYQRGDNHGWTDAPVYLEPPQPARQPVRGVVSDTDVEAVITSVEHVNTDGMDGYAWDRILVRAALEAREAGRSE